MAFIKCEKCGAKISDLEDKCPYCNEPIKKNIFESGNTIDFRYQDEPIYKAAKWHFYATLLMILAIIIDIAGILLIISMEYIVGFIILGVGIILTVLSIIFLLIGKKMRIKAEAEDLNN